MAFQEYLRIFSNFKVLQEFIGNFRNFKEFLGIVRHFNKNNNFILIKFNIKLRVINFKDINNYRAKS